MGLMHKIERAVTPRAFRLWDRNLGVQSRLYLQWHQADKIILKALSSLIGIASQKAGKILHKQAIRHELAIWGLQNMEILPTLAPLLARIDGGLMKADGVVESPVIVQERHKMLAKDAVVWVFDDLRDLADGVKEALEMLGFTNVKAFYDPRDWTKQGEVVPDLVITDMNMGVIGLNGRNLIDAMHEQYSTKRPKFVLICAPENPENIKDKDYLEAQRDTKFFRKPMSLIQIEEHLHALFDFEA